MLLLLLLFSRLVVSNSWKAKLHGRVLRLEAAEELHFRANYKKSKWGAVWFYHWNNIIATKGSSILKEINPEYSLEGLMLKLKLLWPPDVKNWLIWKDPDARKDWRREEKGTTEDEMVEWHYWRDRNEFEQASGRLPHSDYPISHHCQDTYPPCLDQCLDTLTNNVLVGSSVEVSGSVVSDSLWPHES